MNLKFLVEERVMMRDIHTAVNDIECGMKEIASAMDYLDTSDRKKISRTLVGELLQEGIKNFERGIKSFEYFKDNMKSIENGVLKEAEKIKKELNENIDRYEIQKYESQSLVSIANNREFIEKDILSIDTPDGFVRLSLSRHLGSETPIPNEIGDKYLYNKNGEVISVNTGQRLKLHHNEFKASHEGVVYELYMPKNSILASRVDPDGENDDILFRTIKEACEHFKCNYRTIKSCLDKSGEKEFKGYYFEYGWPEPYVLGVKKRPIA